jgi:hypothetical protein
VTISRNMKFYLTAAAFVIMSITVAFAQNKKPFELQYFSVFYYLPVSAQPVELERQIPNETVTGGKLLLSMPGEKSPVRITAATPMEFVVRVKENFDVASRTLQLFRFDTKKGDREYLTADKRTLENGIKLKARPYGSSSLKVTPAQPLPPGEYCLSRTTTPGGFCFGVDPAP